ncbi:hypothetical protein JIG36_22130 [Actinoplanes sp. LDG1-06]|uniref:Uncharacterized protein n=1 Tax=Paractinoplanes ovalisporus TaxID=2810368 RepID=A0ABS2AEK2_9ACTN|nr:hypothetical protein [Actinoplanes ovalisporus]MBM2618262.1 hypothetical protein [Actinoplanes ovalisporus]
MKKAFGAALAAALGVVLGVPGVASAAWHLDAPPQVMSGWTDSAKPGKAFPAAGQQDFPLGTWTDEAGVTRTSRVYATFDLSAYEGAKLSGGTVYVQENTRADCTKRSIEIWRTKPVSAAPTWNKAPAELTRLDGIQTAGVCARTTIGFDVSAGIAEAAAAKQRLVTFELRVPAEHEADPSYAKTLYWYYDIKLNLSYNHAPKVDNAHLYNAGFPCTQLKPYPVVSGFAGRLQALVTDVDADAGTADGERLTGEFALWPVGSPDDRSVYTDSNARSGFVANANVPVTTLVQGKSYGWQARVSDGTETSAWSKKCFFTYDGNAPSAPDVTSTTHRPNEWGPVGVDPTFVFDGHKDKDIAGFQYSWTDLGVSGVCEGGEYLRLVCHDPFTEPRTVRADVPGGKVTLTLNPDATGPKRLSVRSLDAAGNTSPTKVYEVLIAGNEPAVTVESGTPRWNEEVLLKLTPHDGVPAVSEYLIEREGVDGVETREADENGVAYFSFIASNPNYETITVRSRSANGFTSAPSRWWTTFAPYPEVESGVYDGTTGPSGGVGVPGSFTFFPPAGWPEVASYRYSFDGDEPTTIDAGENGRATVTWTPTTEGYHWLEVQAVKPDGTVGDYSNYYSFEVASS